MGILSKNNAKDEKAKRGDAGPADDFKSLDTLDQEGTGLKVGPVGPAQAAVAGSFTPLPGDHPALAPDEIIPPGATRAELVKNESYEPAPRVVPESLADPKRVIGLSKNYLAASIDSLKRVPNPSLTVQFRARLETFREMVVALIHAGVKGEPKIIASVVGALAVDGPGKIDATVFLRQVMGQVLWLGSADIARLRRPRPERDEQRDAPMGMHNMSDHSDTIQGIVGPDTNPNREMTEDDVFGAVMEVHGLLSSMADTLPDNEDERTYLRLDAGLSFCDERVDDPSQPGGARWEPVFELEKAMDIQLVKNAESIKAKEARNAERRAKQLQALAKLY